MCQTLSLVWDLQSSFLRECLCHPASVTARQADKTIKNLCMLPSLLIVTLKIIIPYMYSHILIH